MNTDTISPRQRAQRSTTTVAPADRQPAGELLIEYVVEYARERPEVVALWAFGIGFCLGWKLKPW